MNAPNERGFSLLIVLLVLVMLGMAGASAVAISNAEVGTAGARSLRVQALNAAEAGLAQFQRTAAPSRMDEGWYLGGDDDYFLLPATTGPSGEVVQGRYRVRGEGAGALPMTGRALVEGEVLVDGRVASRAEVAVILLADGSLGDAGTHQEDINQTGGSADLPGAADKPTSLQNL